MTQINLLPWREQARQMQKLQFGFYTALIVAAAFILTMMIHIYSKNAVLKEQQRTAYLQSTLEHENGIFMTLNQNQKEQTAVVSELNFIFSMRKTSYDAIKLLDALPKVVPDAVSFNKVIRTNNLITILGKSTSNLQITLLMKNISDSHLFKQPELKEITGKENMTGDERFFQITVEQP